MMTDTWKNAFELIELRARWMEYSLTIKHRLCPLLTHPNYRVCEQALALYLTVVLLDAVFDEEE